MGRVRVLVGRSRLGGWEEKVKEVGVLKFGVFKSEVVVLGREKVLRGVVEIF